MASALRFDLGGYGCRRLRVVAAISMVVAAASACRSNPRPRSTAIGSKPADSVTVFAAASLTGAFADLQSSLKASEPALAVTPSYGSSGSLVAQVKQGAPADVIATADTATIETLTDAGLVETPVTFARNKLEIVVAAGNPTRIGGLADLARPDLRVVLGDDTVPIGRYGAQILRGADVTVNPVSRELDVKAALARVTSGEADASMVYVTDVRAAGPKAQGVPIPDAQNVMADYPIAIVKATRNHAAAAAFVEAVVGGVGQTALRRHGFLPVP